MPSTANLQPLCAFGGRMLCVVLSMWFYDVKEVIVMAREMNLLSVGNNNCVSDIITANSLLSGCNCMVLLFNLKWQEILVNGLVTGFSVTSPYMHRTCNLQTLVQNQVVCKVCVGLIG